MGLYGENIIAGRWDVEKGSKRIKELHQGRLDLSKENI